MAISFLSGLTVLLIGQLYAAGFATGLNFKATPISGQAQITCQTDSTAVTYLYRCFNRVLLPSPYDYFQSDPGLVADEVTLVAKRSDGSTQKKTAAYDSVQNRSSTRFNLWIVSLTQIPLLMDGENDVDYSMTKEGAEVSTGNFKVTIDKNPTAFCPDIAYYESKVLDDCDNQFAVCTKFFAEHNNCLPLVTKQ